MACTHKSTMVFWGLFLALFALVEHGATQRSPTISYISQEQIKDIGGTVELVCSVQYAQEYPVLWLKNDAANANIVPISTLSSLILQDSRFSLRYDKASSTYTLQIKDIQETDAGTYKCQVLISVNNKITADVQLQVRRPPIISDNSTRSLVVSEGEAVQLECYASGYPSPRISWRRENNAILPSGGSIYRGNILSIKQVKKEDRGTYYCVAENGVGKGARRNIAVEVEFAPVVTVPRPRLGQALQYDMDLECHVVAYPPPAIVWVKDDVQLSNNQHYSISHFATADEFTDTTIRVITIESDSMVSMCARLLISWVQLRAALNFFEISVPNINYPGLIWENSSDKPSSTPALSVTLSSLLLVMVIRR